MDPELQLTKSNIQVYKIFRNNQLAHLGRILTNLIKNIKGSDHKDIIVKKAAILIDLLSKIAKK